MERSSSRLWVRVAWICVSLGAIVALWYALTRDIRYSREYMGDLRNRVVGARLIKDGYSPYFYKYSPGDPVRYYDPQAFDIYFVSICTSTPFLHRLLIPLADWPFATIMRVWLVLLYLLYLAMAAYAFAFTRAPEARAAVLLTALLFLVTNAWELHTKYGQTYLLIPALAMLTFALRRWPVLAGLAAAGLVMIRPNAILFVLPFLLMRNFKWSFIVPGVVALAWVLLSPRERGLWQDYSTMIGEQVKIHQDLGPKRRPVWIDPGYKEWEGLNKDTIQTRIARDPVRIYSENGNLFVLYRKIVGRQMPLGFLLVLGLLSVGSVMMALVLVRRRYGELQPAQLAIIGFCLYMISDLFSPIYRHAYYGVQWIMPLLLAAALYQKRLNRWYLGLLAALLLNIVHLPFLKMGNTLGEYVFLVCLLAIGLGSGDAESRKSAPVRAS
ncbi:MAG TPA: glycosyltransferase family 87 protein [Puia sp.]|nr:glycosyltransferase family 87 protein [Puia sp.]